MRRHISRFGCWASMFAAVAILSDGHNLRAQDKAEAAVKEKQPPKAKTGPKQYRWITVDHKAGQNRRFVISGLRSGAPNEKFDNYYTGFGFRRLIDPKYLATITDVRREFQRDLRDAKGKAFPHLNKLAFRTLPHIIRNEAFHPIARYNATLMLGDLNQVKASQGRAAIPLVDALPLLVGKILMDPNQIDAVRVAALIGIRRHAAAIREHDLAVLAAGKATITSTMLKIVGAKNAGKGRSPEGHQWMRRQAIEILGELGDAGLGGVVAKAMAETAADKESPLWVRCAAAHSLGQFKSKPTDLAPVDAEKLADTLRDLAADVCMAEMNRAKGDKTGVSQQQLLADLGCVQAGLKAAGEPAKNAEFVKKFDALYALVASAPDTIPIATAERGLNQFLAVASKPQVPTDDPMPKVDEPPVIDKTDVPKPLDDTKEAPGDLDF